MPSARSFSVSTEKLAPKHRGTPAARRADGGTAPHRQAAYVAPSPARPEDIRRAASPPAGAGLPRRQRWQQKARGPRPTQRRMAASASEESAEASGNWYSRPTVQLSSVRLDEKGAYHAFLGVVPMEKEAEPDGQGRLRPSAAASLRRVIVQPPRPLYPGRFGKALTEQPDGTDDKAEAEDRRRQPEEQERGIKAGDAAEAPRPQQLIARVSLRCAETEGPAPAHNLRK